MQKKKKTKDKETDKLENMEQNITDENVEEYNLLKEELNQIRQERLKGFIIRSKTQQIEESEKVTFLNLEKSNYVNKTINKLQTSSGQILEDQNKMKFYQQLYNSPNAETQEDWYISDTNRN